MGEAYPKSDARHYTVKTQKQLREIITQIRQTIDKVTDPKARALLETSAEVLTGLQTAFEHYEQKSEKAWQ